MQVAFDGSAPHGRVQTRKCQYAAGPCYANSALLNCVAQNFKVRGMQEFGVTMKEEVCWNENGTQ